jgi:hypothetical protein
MHCEAEPLVSSRKRTPKLSPDNTPFSLDAIALIERHAVREPFDLARKIRIMRGSSFYFT